MFCVSNWHFVCQIGKTILFFVQSHDKKVGNPFGLPTFLYAVAESIDVLWLVRVREYALWNEFKVVLIELLHLTSAVLADILVT